ncbi:MAG: tripartite tricarboxylate transporter substrate binding protein [Proteobacteria bacterium]|nr:tripartite tricarboxylate transporter substrate binding protein [Pseudomonadota bacterium]
MLKRIALAFAAAALLNLSAFAQDFPSRPVRIIVPWPPSGNVDITARTVAPALAEALGQQVIVENRPGAGGTTGTAAVAKSAPDGYTLLLGSSGTVTNAPAVYKNITYDPVKDLTAIGPIQSVPMVLTAAPKTPVNSFAEYVAYARSKPGQVSVASAGNGSSNHLAIELLMRQTGLKLIHIPYKGSGPAITDVLGSQVESMVDQMTASIGHVREGRMKALAVTSRLRSPMLPNVPTLAELGVANFEASTFTGIFGPAGMPQAVVDKLHAALKKALTVESVRERYRSMGVEIMDMSQPDFAAYVRTDYEKWRSVARDANIVVD